jgi:hypothetical protein
VFTQPATKFISHIPLLATVPVLVALPFLQSVQHFSLPKSRYNKNFPIVTHLIQFHKVTSTLTQRKAFESLAQAHCDSSGAFDQFCLSR